MGPTRKSAPRTHEPGPSAPPSGDDEDGLRARVVAAPLGIGGGDLVACLVRDDKAHRGQWSRNFQDKPLDLHIYLLAEDARCFSSYERQGASSKKTPHSSTKIDFCQP
ncbi:MAG: hypothetical protein COW24_00800 [Candidatus Kerfeldbacteria bacterium CG15_BIG_FIL_POST_REV_8_21_14_020_45_12]|uniref:Uncharacterized protein n=1 Tax=Candidatus Kerfeldbacteria bacterium CG15_BIG_FIL_POST_REV_8_21_14_020_45_12 TaxID=2014247 RepID=A0A2M7H505_9BACT|nr:MAG: hypothetical protein COW24_00800 [Candidatus Kerfeldbacteria bacterium CG15_BIG_FIL_POST_REV_8_21_14_020_45_12]PJA93181.1 MAG: hypothetical protein CO132_04335 [Candidatus Kerfeldbacteria bacterium CG_4_9_14_3_um_filter_45_8]